MTMGPVALGALGFLLGMRHATDADHVVAVTVIVCRERSPRAAMAIGALWGLGHTATIMVVGGAIIFLGVRVPPRLGLALEMAVALMLIVLGGMNLTRAAKPDRSGAHPGARRLGRLRPVAVGLVHGLAGSAAIALLVLSSIHDAFWAFFYLVIFGAGTLLGMMLLTTVMVMPIAAISSRFGTIERVVGTATGLASVLFGLVLAYRLGIVDGLFTSVPRWTPH